METGFQGSRLRFSGQCMAPFMFLAAHDQSARGGMRTAGGLNGWLSGSNASSGVAANATKE